MSDNVTANPGAGGAVFASDDVGGVQYPRAKITYGVDGAAADVTVANGLPVQPQSGAVFAVSGTFWQTTQPVTQPDALVITNSVTSATNLFSQDTTNYKSISVQVTSAGSSCTITYEVSNDNSTWASITGWSSAGTGSSASVQTSGSVTTTHFPLISRYFRARVSTYGSGTVSVTAVLRVTPMAGAAMLAATTPGCTGASTSRLTMSKIKAAASTNSTLIKSSSGNLYGYSLSNTTASAKFFKLYNKSSAPTVGTDTPALTLSIPANSTVSWSNDIGFQLSTGIGYGISGAVGESDTTATAVDDVVGYLVWQ